MLDSLLLALTTLCAGDACSSAIADGSASGWMRGSDAAAPGGENSPRSAAEETVIEEYELTLQLDAFEQLQEHSLDDSGQVKRSWSASVANTQLDLRLVVLSESFGLRDALQVIELLEENRQGDDRGYAFDPSEALDGIYGWTRVGWLGAHPAEGGYDRVVIAGVLRKQAYFLELLPREPAGVAFLEAARAFALEGVRYTGASRDPAWTEEELAQRWEEIAPDRVKEQGELGVRRTKHYVILTNMRANGGTVKKFGKLMEERYEEIRELFPFDDLPGGRLLPIYLFQTPAQYHAFLVKVLQMSQEEAERTAGIAYADFYSTSYAAPNDPVHKHEAVHQIFSNVLRLNGGGSWFQEGVAEYAEGKKNDRKPFRNVVKREKHMPLREFFALRSLIFSQDIDKKQGDRAGDSYLQAGCLIEYVAESKELKEQFQAFVHRMGSLRRNDVDGIEGVLQDLYQLSLDDFEAGFLEYWRKR